MAAGGSDAERIQTAMRLGWAVAELRGRYRRGDDPREASGALASRPDHFLPLSAERSAAEMRIETERVTAALAEPLEVRSLPSTGARPGVDDVPARLVKLAAERRAASAERRDDDAAAAWERIADLLFRWDAEIQDTLAAGEFGVSSAYQVGRGLAETYWALDPDAPPTAPSSWCHLLGDQRRRDLTALLQRLSPIMAPYTCDALKGSLARWGAEMSAVSEAGGLPTADHVSALRHQMQVWRDLLLMGGDPLDLLEPGSGVRLASRVEPLLGAFVPELVGLLAGIVLLVVTAVLLATGAAAPSVVTAVVGAAGVTVAGVAARVKTVAQDVVGQLRRRICVDLVIEAATRLPLSADGLHAPPAGPPARREAQTR